MALTRDELVDLVTTFVRDELLDADVGFTSKSNLIESGLESLGLTQLLLAIEERTGLWVDESLLTPENLETAETLAGCVYGQLRS